MNIKTNNPKPITQNLDTFEKAPEPRADMGRILETMGQTSGQSPIPGQTQQAVDEQKRIQDLKAADKARSQELLAKLEAEMAKWRKVREDQLKQRCQVDEQTQAQVKSAQEAESPLAQPPSKQKRGMLFGMGNRRLKTAQDQAAPEQSGGKRVGG